MRQQWLRGGAGCSPITRWFDPQVLRSICWSILGQESESFTRGLLISWFVALCGSISVLKCVLKHLEWSWEQKGTIYVPNIQHLGIHFRSSYVTCTVTNSLKNPAVADRKLWFLKYGTEASTAHAHFLQRLSPGWSHPMFQSQILAHIKSLICFSITHSSSGKCMLWVEISSINYHMYNESYHSSLRQHPENDSCVQYGIICLLSFPFQTHYADFA